MPTIALLTDFGLSDHYVGILKAVLVRICPEAQLIDICHTIPAGDILRGAYTLQTAYRYFPVGTHFLVVVDPGVGSERKALLIQTDNYTFIGPDNGVLSLAIADEQTSHIIELNNPDYFLQPISPTFQGRDIFAPVTAYAAQGVQPSCFGTSVQDINRLHWPQPSFASGTITGMVLAVDHFGNVITTINKDFVHQCLQEVGGVKTDHAWPTPLNTVLSIGHYQINGIDHTYANRADLTLMALFGSSNFLEIAINRGSAQELLHCQPGDKVTLLLKASEHSHE